MEKIIYPLWKRPAETTSTFREQLLTVVSANLLQQPNIHGIRICIVDDDVAAAAPYRMANICQPPFDAIIMIWLDTAINRQKVDNTLEQCVATFCCYLVAESEPLKNSSFIVDTGSRTPGMNQVVLLQRPEHLSFDEWIDIWHNSHTQIALDTQSTFAYRQNLVVRKLTENAPDIDAIIEENFPPAAIHSRQAFYDAGNDEGLYKEREKTMIESCARFIDFDRLDCIPTSETIFKQL